MLVTESWMIDDADPGPVPPATVAAALRLRLDHWQLETWLISSSGRMLGFVTNHERAMVMLLQGGDDPGEHAVSPGAEGSSDGFVLCNGQDDAYPDEDTVPIREACRLVEQIVGTGSWPTDASWVTDR